MSVVVQKGMEEKFASLFPQLHRYAHTYRLWQKAHISNYYDNKENYWKDYDRYSLSESLGLDRLKINDPYFLSDNFYPFPWDPEKWTGEVLPVLSSPWATEWSIMEKYILHLIYNQQADKARHLVQLYQSHLSAEALPIFSKLLELKLAAALATDNEEEVLSVSNKLIGITNNQEYGSYWGHYFNGMHLMASGDHKGAVQLLLPVLNDLRLGSHYRSKSFRCILDALNEICLIDPSLIEPEKRPIIEVARIHFAADR